MKKFEKKAFAALALALFAGAANASQFDGAYVGGALTTDRNTMDGSAPGFYSEDRETATAMKVVGGYRATLDGPFSLGAEADYTFGKNVKTSTFSLKPGVTFGEGDKFLGFTKLGYAHAQLDGGSFNGFNYGLGLSYAVSPQWVLTGEFDQTKFRDQVIDDVSYRLKQTRFGIGAAYRF